MHFLILASCLQKHFLLLLMTGEGVLACKVLVVDDDQRTREALVEILHRAGYDVIGLASGDGMEDLLGRHDFAAAIIDYHLPSRNGLEIAQSLRQILPACRIVLISSEYQPRHQICNLPTMVDRFLAKPFSKTALLDIMLELCPMGMPIPG
jgi:DNA-binding response OmpR family regulator